MAQFARPISTVTGPANWSPQGGPTTLWDCVDEVTASDVDFMRSTGTPATAELGLSSVTDPASGTGHIIRFRAKSTGSAAVEKCEVQLFEGATQRATTSAQTLSRTAFGNFTYTLTTVEADAIVNYADLRFRVVPTHATSGENVDVSWMELEVPPNPQTISGAGNIASGETFGVLSVALTLLLTGIGSAEAFGSAQLNLNISPSAISSAEAFGTATVSLAGADQTISPSSITSQEVFGTAQLNLNVSPPSITSQEALGTAQLGLNIAGAGAIASQEAFGSTQLNLNITPSGIITQEAFGTTTISVIGTSLISLPVLRRRKR